MSKAAQTRHYILEKAFDLIYEHGYQATSIDKIIETTSVTKGAFYYHFKNKDVMGLAVINEVIRPRFEAQLIKPLADYEDALAGIFSTIKNFMLNLSEDQLNFGCPTNNMIHEMAPLDPVFREALNDLLEDWKKALTQALTRAAAEGQIKEQDFDAVATFIIAGYEGTRGIGKLKRTFAYYQTYLSQLKAYLSTL